MHKSKLNEEEKHKSMFDPLFNDANSVADDEKEYFTIEHNKKSQHLDVQDNLYENAGIFSTIFFKWVNPVIKISQQKRLSSVNFGKISNSYKSEVQKELIYKNWKYYSTKSNNPIFRALIATYSKELCTIFAYSFVKCIMIIAQPVLVLLILDYIQDSSSYDGGIYYGLGLVILYNLIGILANLIGDQSDFIQAVIGINAKHGVIGMVYDKVLKTSQSTNKKFSQGEIINFINVDVEKVTNVSSYLSYLVLLPIQTVFGFCFMFYCFHYYLFVSVAVGIIFALMCFCIGLLKEFLQKKICIEKDKRISATAEVINCIKIIKFNSLADVFLEKIQKLRNKELFLTKVSLIVEIFSLFLTLALSALMLFALIFVYYFGGNTLTVPMAFSVMMVFNMLEIPLKFVPLLINSIIEFTVSMKRIHQFLISNEINPKLVSVKNNNLSNESAIQIDNANFTWGGQKRDSKGEENNKEFRKSESLTVRKSIVCKNINLSINKGEFICVIGEVGSGKSSTVKAFFGTPHEMSFVVTPSENYGVFFGGYDKGFYGIISAILGDLIYVSDETFSIIGDKILDEKIHDGLCNRCMLARDVIRLSGSICLVQQNPWIQNKTIRDNILFGHPFDNERYNRTIKSCQLIDDLEILKGGDLTEIGERGINLSGGQKARISLARAVYSGCDIVLMDDPISAVDSNVKHKIFEEVLCGELRNKTRILVTHATLNPDLNFFRTIKY